MLVKVVCPNPECAASFAVPEDVIGRTGRCKKCGKTFPMQGTGTVSPAASVRVEGTRVNAYSVVPEGSQGGEPSFVADASPRMARRSIPAQFGRYRIKKAIGQGGMGAVYLAFDTQLDRDVALKIPHIGPQDGSSVLDRFYREAKAAATFDHPNLCPIYDVGAIDGVPYLTMPFLTGKPLSDTIDKAEPLSPREAAAITSKLALALAEAHRRGIIHRDLKPANVMVCDGRDLVIMDFGLARREQTSAESRLTNSGAVLGTPSYMAPEQVRGDLDAMGAATDVYSLGVIFYELLTGRLPFEGPPGLVMGLIALTEPPAPSSHRPDLDRGLEAVCLRAMARRIEDRFASMEEFAAALDQFLDSGSVGLSVDETTPRNDGGPVLENERPAEISLRSRHRPPRTRRRWVVACAATLAAVLGVILWVQTDNGTIQIVLSDPNAMVKVTVDGDEVTRRSPDQTVRLKAGKSHTLKVIGEEFATVSESFRLGRGEEKVLTVVLKRNPVVIASKPPKRVDDRAAAVKGIEEPKPKVVAGKDDPKAAATARIGPAPEAVANGAQTTTDVVEQADPPPEAPVDPIKARLDEGLLAYQTHLEKLKQELVDSLGKKEEDARQKGRPQEVERLKAELQALQGKGELPKPIPKGYQGEIKQARSKMADAFEAALKAYLKDHQDQKFAEIKGQYEEFRKNDPSTRAIVGDALQAQTHWIGSRIDIKGTQKDYELRITRRKGSAFAGEIVIDDKRTYQVEGSVYHGWVRFYSEKRDKFYCEHWGPIQRGEIRLSYAGTGVDGKRISGTIAMILQPRPAQ